MHDVVRQVVLAEGDEDLRAEDAIGAVVPTLGPRAQRREVRAGLRLGEVHRAHPFAGHELVEIGRAERVRPVRLERVDRTERQGRPDAEGHRRAVPHLVDRGRQRGRQALPAMVHRPGQSVPAAVDPAVVEVAPARRHGHGAVAPDGAGLVAPCGQRGDLAIGKPPGFVQDRIKEIGRQVARRASRHRVLEPRDMPKREADLAHRCPIHPSSSRTS